MITRLKGQFFGLKKIIALTAVLAIGVCSLSTSVKAWDRSGALQAGGVAFGLYIGYRLLAGALNWVFDEDLDEIPLRTDIKPTLVVNGDFKSIDEIGGYVRSFAQDPIFSDVDFEELLNHVCIDFQNHITQVKKAQVWKRMMDLRPSFVIQVPDSNERLYPQLDGFNVVGNVEPSAPSQDFVMAHDLQQQERQQIEQQIRQLDADLRMLQQGQLPVGYANGVSFDMLILSVQSERDNLSRKLG